MNILHRWAEVTLGHAIGHTDEAGGTGVAKEVAVDSAQSCDVAGQQRVHHGTQTSLLDLFPPLGGSVDIGRGVLFLHGCDVSGADSIEKCGVVVARIEAGSEAFGNALEVVARIVGEAALTALGEAAHVHTRRDELLRGAYGP